MRSSHLFFKTIAYEKVIFVWLVIVLLLQVQAAPVALPVDGNRDTVNQHIVPVQPIIKLNTVKKSNFLQKAALWAVERKIARKSKKGDDGNLRQKRTLGTISLVSGIAGVVLLFAVPVVGIFLLPVAFITGIIGLSNNTDKGSCTSSIIGIVLGVSGCSWEYWGLFMHFHWPGYKFLQLFANLHTLFCL